MKNPFSWTKLGGGDRVHSGCLMMDKGLKGFCQGGFLAMLWYPWRMSRGKEA
jgi:hypothetical protein